MLNILNGALGVMASGPKPLERCLDASAALNGDGRTRLSPEDLFLHMERAGVGDPAVESFRRVLAAWDSEETPDWAAGTARNTDERRRTVYRVLCLPKEHALLCDRLFPPFRVEPPVVIAGDHHLWYDENIQRSRNFYWEAYSKQLREVHHWPSRSLMELDESTRGVVARLADPLAIEAYKSKGLVVGYVQSGKTANFTGVIAKAADAGYRLIIVLAGTLDVLRSQTQRRLDKDLIGCELLGDDYQNDDDYDDFMRHGGLPSTLGSFDWMRLTRPESDYRNLHAGIEALAFERADPSKPFYAPENALRAKARIMVVKKNAAVLNKIVDDLEIVRKRSLGAPLDQVAALIIDDESDQASVNVARPSTDSSGDLEDRTAINRAIVTLLGLLPRSQYVGYTATPFANVFVDPNSEPDIFPKDFVVSLPRPDGYMGVRDFYDLDGSPDVPGSQPNRDDYVRAVIGPNNADNNLPRAIDSFVLSGALKLFRMKADPSLHYRHHTMLAHSSARTADHTALAREIRTLFDNAGYEAGGGIQRLMKLFDEDFAVVRARRAPNLPFPTSFEALAPFVGECLRKINAITLRAGSGGRSDDTGPVLVINNLNRDQTPDFDRQEIWKILVGGTKLSRGYTVEGLTISYYRRRSQTSDTLMQMGRWFGFRRGYHDLVRLFVGTKEPIGTRGKGTFDLYEAFGAICRDEEFFRAELERYASLEEPRVLPKHIPPLVPSHMLRPTARNKMYNAYVKSRNFGGELAESTLAPDNETAKRSNIMRAESLLKSARLRRVELNAGSHRLEALVGSPSKSAVLSFLRGYKWLQGHPMLAQIEYLEGRYGDPQIDSWIVVAPQASERRAVGTVLVAGHEVRVLERTRGHNKLTTYNTAPHRRFATHLTGVEPLPNPDEDLKFLTRSRQAVMLFYATSESSESVDDPWNVGFTLLFPPNRELPVITFGVHNLAEPDAPIVTT